MKTRQILTAIAATLLLFGSTACGSSDESSQATTSITTNTAVTETTSSAIETVETAKITERTEALTELVDSTTEETDSEIEVTEATSEIHGETIEVTCSFAETNSNSSYQITETSDIYDVLKKLDLGISDTWYRYNISDVAENDSYVVYTLQQTYGGMIVNGRTLTLITDKSGYLVSIEGKCTDFEEITVADPYPDSYSFVYTARSYMETEYGMGEDNMTIKTEDEKAIFTVDDEYYIGAVVDIYEGVIDTPTYKVYVDAASLTVKNVVAQFDY